MSHSRKLSNSYPNFIFRESKDFEELKSFIREFIRSLNEFKRLSVVVIDDHANRLDPTEGTVAPVSTPAHIGLLFLDTVAKDVYIAVGTASSEDWKKITQ